MARKLQLRRDTAARWESLNPVLADGEIGIEKDTGLAKLGNGSDGWTALPYFDPSGFEARLAAVENGTHSGPPGPQGPAGPQGPQGPQGSGAQGPEGPQGPQGPAGPVSWGDLTDWGAGVAYSASAPKSLVRYSGSTYVCTVSHTSSAAFDGTKFAQLAAQGPAGPQGPAGAAGAQGPTGPQGAQGAAGPSGPTGPQGPAGNTGPQGPEGPTGATGPQGIQGPDGQSFVPDVVADSSLRVSYDAETLGFSFLAIDLGAIAFKTANTSGAWSSWVPFGRGPTGPQGPAGATGAVGPQGPAGPQGETGPQGATGPQGPEGPQGPAGAQGSQGPTGNTGPAAWSAVTAWSAGQTYVVDPPASAVTYGGETYVCITGHTSGGAFDGAKFAKIAQKGADELGLLVNPFFEVSQENGSTLLSDVGSTGAYAADQWKTLESAATLVMSAQSVATPFSGTAGYKRLASSVKGTATTAQASLGSSEVCTPIQQTIEGTFWRSLGWGTSDARNVVVVGVVMASVSGTYAISLRNAAGTRSMVKTVALTANTPTVICETFSGDTSGTWVTANAASAVLEVGTTTGSTYETASLGSWLSGDYRSATTATDWQGTTSAFVQAGYLNVFPVGALPWSSASEITGEALQRLINMRRPFDEERRRCQRYYKQTYADGTQPGSATSVGAVFNAFEASTSYGFLGAVELDMRTTPALTLYSVLGASGKATVDGVDKIAAATGVGPTRASAYLSNQAVTVAQFGYVHFVTDARM